MKNWRVKMLAELRARYRANPKARLVYQALIDARDIALMPIYAIIVGTCLALLYFTALRERRKFPRGANPTRGWN
jgi:hypothetical protein